MSKIQVTLNINDEHIKRSSGGEELEEAINRELDWLKPGGIDVEGWTFLDKEQENNLLQSFIYTFGTADSFPFQRGWIEVQAQNRQQADQAFRSQYPDITPGILNCSSIYHKEEFQPIWEDHYKDTDWDVCHQIIQVGVPVLDTNMRDAFVLTCVHEHEYGDTWYTSIHATEEEAKAHVEPVRKKANVEEERGEYFNVNIEKTTFDISGLKPHHPLEHLKAVVIVPEDIALEIQEYLKEIQSHSDANDMDKRNATILSLNSFLQGASYALPEHFAMEYDEPNIVNIKYKDMQMPIAFVTKTSYLQNTALQKEMLSKPSLESRINHAEEKRNQVEAGGNQKEHRR